MRINFMLYVIVRYIRHPSITIDVHYIRHMKEQKSPILPMSTDGHMEQQKERQGKESGKQDKQLLHLHVM